MKMLVNYRYTVFTMKIFLFTNPEIVSYPLLSLFSPSILHRGVYITDINFMSVVLNVENYLLPEYFSYTC